MIVTEITAARLVPEASPFDMVGAIIFMTFGAAFLLLARPLINLQIRLTERQLKRLQEKPPIIFMRLFGALFFAFGLFMAVMVVRAAR